MTLVAPAFSSLMSSVQAWRCEAFQFRHFEVVFTLRVRTLGMLGPLSRSPGLFQHREYRKYNVRVAFYHHVA